MRIPRCYCENIQTESVLDATESGHLCRVLRANEGTVVELFDGKGTLATGCVLHSDKKKATVRVDKIEKLQPCNSARLILAVSFAKGQRFDWLVEKCTELGVDHIAAIQYEHTVKLGKANAMDRYHKIAITAAKQSKRLFLPQITGPEKLEPTLDSLNQLYPDSVLVFGDPNGKRFRETFLKADQRNRIVAIGPEAGFSEREIEHFKKLSGSGILINKNILRIETAALAFCAILSAECK